MVTVIGETRPDSSNTGLNVLGLTTADLTVVDGDLLITNALADANNDVFDRLWVKGHVVHTANRKVTLSNSIVQGRPFSGQPPRTALVYARSTSTPSSAVIDVINCEVFAIQPDVDIVGLSGERIGETWRNNIYWVSDGINHWGSVVKSYGNYIHDFTFWANDPKHANDGSHPGWSHNDGIQSNGCANPDIIGNTIDMRATPDYGDYATLIAGGFPGGAWGSAVMLTGSAGYITSALVQKNWVGYGQAPICMPYQSSGAYENNGCSWDVSGNRVFGLPDPYGASQRQFIRWGYNKGPAPASVYDNTFTYDAAIPAGLRGTLLPVAVLVGSASNSGQYIVRLNA